MADHDVSPATDRPDRGGADRRIDLERGRRTLQEGTFREVRRLAEEFDARLPRSRATAVGMIYARFSTRFQASIGDQVRACYEAAVARGIHVPAENVCFDLAVKGSKLNRAGLARARARIEAGGVTAFLAFATNRLHRKMHRCLAFVEEELVERGIRAIFPKSNVDTADAQRWKMLLNFHAMMDEFVVSMYADNVRAAHEGLMDRGLVYGTVPFGYAGEPIPGEFTKQKRPRRRLVVDLEAAPIVERIYRWYADEGVAIDEVVRRLNDDPSIPLPPRSLTGSWSRPVVRALLGNPRYRGNWRYGVMQGIWQSKKDYARQVPRAEPLRSAQVEALRIVPDELWYRVQRRLAEEPNRGGRKPADGDRRSRPRLLNGLFRCPAHDRRLYVGGPHGRMMFCKDCRGLPAAKRPLFTQLNRALALNRTCSALAELVRADEDLVGRVVAACREEVGRAGQPDPATLEGLRRAIQRDERQIRFLLENAGETEADRRESGERLRALRRSRAEAAADLARREAARSRAAAVPDEAAVRSLLEELGTTLEAAEAGEEPETAREVLTLLTGGRIDLEQQGERSAQRGWLRGRFRVALLPYLANRAGGVDLAAGSEGVEVVVDYREPDGAETLADRAKALYDDGRLIKEIASELKAGRALVVAALEHWYTSRGLAMPDGRSRRATLARKHREPPAYQRLADRAKEAYDKGLLLQEIASLLRCDRNTVTKAIDFWFTSRGQEAPDGRARRKTLDRKGSPPTRRRNGEPRP